MLIKPVIGFDPGLKQAGYAMVWRRQEKLYCESVAIRGDLRLPWEQRIVDIMNKIKKHKFKTGLTPRLAVIEHMEVRHAEGYNKTPGLLKLAVLEGAMVMHAASKNAFCLLPTPSTWKGSQTKRIQHGRLQKIFGRDQRTPDEWDAIGLALWGLELKP